jgi:acetyl-CoA C-acetyltransferase
MKANRRVAICGGGIFRPDLWHGENAEEGVAIAYQDLLRQCPNLGADDIDAVSMSYFSDHLNQQLCMGWIIQDYLGLHNKPGYRIEAGGSTPFDALANAYYLIQSGLYDVVLVAGWEWMCEVDVASTNEMIASAADTDFDFPVGGYYNAYYAALEVRHMQLYGETPEDLGKIAVKNHNNSTHVPWSQWISQRGTTPITLDDYWNSRMVCWPYRVLNNAVMSEGAAVMLLAAEEKVKRFTDKPVWITGVGLGTDSMRPGDRTADFAYSGFKDEAAIYPDFVKRPKTPFPDMANFGSYDIAAKRAYAQAGITNPLKEIDLMEVYDPYSGVELVLYEDLGLCGRGQAKYLVREGVTEFGGECPVNVSGALTATGHAVGATSLYYATFLYHELAGDIKEVWGEQSLQVPKAKRGVVTGHGGTGCQAGVAVLESD